MSHLTSDKASINHVSLCQDLHRIVQRNLKFLLKHTVTFSFFLKLVLPLKGRRFHIITSCAYTVPNKCFQQWYNNWGCCMKSQDYLEEDSMECQVSSVLISTAFMRNGCNLRIYWKASFPATSHVNMSPPMDG